MIATVRDGTLAFVLIPTLAFIAVLIALQTLNATVIGGRADAIDAARVTRATQIAAAGAANNPGLTPAPTPPVGDASKSSDSLESEETAPPTSALTGSTDGDGLTVDGVTNTTGATSGTDSDAATTAATAGNTAATQGAIAPTPPPQLSPNPFAVPQGNPWRTAEYLIGAGITVVSFALLLLASSTIAGEFSRRQLRKVDARCRSRCPGCGYDLAGHLELAGVEVMDGVEPKLAPFTFSSLWEAYPPLPPSDPGRALTDEGSGTTTRANQTSTSSACVTVTEEPTDSKLKMVGRKAEEGKGDGAVPRIMCPECGDSWSETPFRGPF